MDKDIETMVAEIEARADKATPGPWKPKVVSSYYGTNGVSAGSCEDVVGMHGASAANAEFIAHAREDVPKLCTMLRERQRRIKSHEHWIKEFRLAWDIPKGTTIHEFMKAMALERDALRERHAKLESAAKTVRAFCDNQHLVRREGCTDAACTGIICGPMKQLWAAIKALDALLTRPPPPTQP